MGKIWRRILIGIVILAAIIGIVAKLLEPEEYTNTKPRQNTECTITQRVLDEAGKMTDKQKKDLEALIAEKEQLIGCDIVILTINEPGLDSYDEIRDYAQAYYEDNKFGWNKTNGDGIIYVDDWATGYTWMCTTGLAKTRLDDTDTEQIVDSANEIVNDNPYEAYTSIVNNAATMIRTGRSSYVQINPIIVFLAAAVIGAVFVGVQLIGHGGKDTVLRSTYAKGGVQMNEKQDIFLYSHVTRTKRPSKSSGGGGKVGGTGGHGGAGGRH